MRNPLDQFLVKRIFELDFFGYDISFTNSSLCMVIISAFLCFCMIFIGKDLRVIPSRFQVFFETINDFIYSVIKQNAGDAGVKFFPIIFSVFLFILSANIFGMLPYSFTVTSHIVVTLTIAFSLFIMITITGFCMHGTKFLSLFLPHGIPLWLSPLMIVIELCAYLTKPFSLGLRLAANMTAGHVLLKVMASFIVSTGLLLKVFPMMVVTALIGFEFCIALLQSYIFAILTCVYLNDALNLH